MSGGTESNGTGVGELHSLVLGIATLYRIFFRFGVGSYVGEFSSLEFAFAVLFLLFRRPLAAGGGGDGEGGAGGGGGGAMRHPSSSCRNIF